MNNLAFYLQWTLHRFSPFWVRMSVSLGLLFRHGLPTPAASLFESWFLTESSYSTSLVCREWRFITRWTMGTSHSVQQWLTLSQAAFVITRMRMIINVGWTLPGDHRILTSEANFLVICAESFEMQLSELEAEVSPTLSENGDISSKLLMEIRQGTRAWIRDGRKTSAASQPLSTCSTSPNR